MKIIHYDLYVKVKSPLLPPYTSHVQGAGNFGTTLGRALLKNGSNVALK